MAGGCPLPGTRKVLAGVPDRDRIIDKASEGRGSAFIWAIPVVTDGKCRTDTCQESLTETGKWEIPNESIGIAW
jgi:hypothetical protein